MRPSGSIRHHHHHHHLCDHLPFPSSRLQRDVSATTPAVATTSHHLQHQNTLHHHRGGSGCMRTWLSRMTSTSLREAIFVLLLVTLASLSITFHLVHDLVFPAQIPEELQRSLNTQEVDNHLNIHRSLHLSGSVSSRRSQRGEGVVGQDGKGRKEGRRPSRDGERDVFGEGGQGGGEGVNTAGGSVAGGSGGGGGGSAAEQFRNVFRILQEREQTIVPGDGGRVRVLVAGSRPQLGQDALLVESALKKHSARVKHLTLELQDGNDNVEKALHGSQLQGGWSVLLCLNTSSYSDDCVVSATKSLSTLPHQKINFIPQLQPLLHQPQHLCRQRGHNGEGQWLRTGLHCTKQSYLSKEAPHSRNEMQSPCEQHPLWLWPSQTFTAPRMTLCTNVSDRPRNGVGLDLPANLLTWEDVNRSNSLTEEWTFRNMTNDEAEIVSKDKPSDWSRALTWRFPVLITSLSPIRVYMHSEGVVWDSLTSYLQEKPQRGLSLLELQQMAADLQGDSVAAAAVNYLEENVMDILVQWEQLVYNEPVRWCPRCFQLLEVTTVFNASFYPFILQIGASSLTGRLSSLSEYLIRQTSLNDLASILTEHRNVSLDLARAFVDMGLSNVQQEKICNSDQRFCLGPKEQVYLLDNLRERLARTGWKRVYPSASAVRFTGLLQAGVHTTTNSSTTSSASSVSLSPRLPSSAVPDEDQPMRTSHLHALLLGLESFFFRASEGGGLSESFEDLNMPIDQSNQRENASQETQLQKTLPDTDVITGPPCSEDECNVSPFVLEEMGMGCSQEPGSLPYLSSIVTRPLLTLHPEFSPFRTDYEVEVEQNVQLVTVWAWSQSCQSQARLEDKHNMDRSANFTLGMGVNTLRIFVVDTTHEEPWVVNTYTLIVRRLEADHGLGPFTPSVPHVVCSLKQDCSLPYAPREACGLQPVNSMASWSQFLAGRAHLPSCTSGDAAGQWYVPCSNCREEDGQCYWKEAVWSPFTCQQPTLSHFDLQQCFRNRKVLFIGDSTNRGILHYIYQRVNGSLWEWPDKTHHLRVYPAVNHNTTVFSFAYYPQFWLPALHRPVFDKALYQLIRRSLPLDNSSKTVVVVGGVHWLATHHLKVVHSALAREGLTGAQVIVKGLGSGFHQPVSGVHQLSQREQEKLLWHNQHVLSYAKEQGMDVVDTFNMTMARYSHFLQGRCTCHFHRITPQKHQRSGDHSLPVTTYKVEGDINAAYAEMVINSVCRPS